MTCLHAHDDGVYVLGALAPAERLAFERHLDDCTDCSRRVRELAGLTGLLAQAPTEVLAQVSADADTALPATVLPGLLDRVRRDRRRRRWLTAGVAAAGATVGVTVGALGAGLVDGPTDGPTVEPTGGPVREAPPDPPAPTAEADLAPARVMRPVTGSEVTMTARLALTGVPWGTRLDLACSYPTAAGGGAGGYGSYGSAAGERATYTLVVRTRDGAVEEVATWRARPGRSMQLTAATAVPRREIATVQVRTGDGSPVVQLRG